MPNLGSIDLATLQRLWGQSFELNMRYYRAVSNLMVDYYKELLGTYAGIASTQSQPQPQVQPNPDQPAAPAGPGQARPATATPTQAGVMVLEGESTGEALGVFLVANNLQETVTARVSASSFVNETGHTVQPTFSFDPEVISLAPGEQLVVRVTTRIPDTLEPEVRYRGEFAVPELSGTRIPIVMRRRAAAVRPESTG